MNPFKILVAILNLIFNIGFLLILGILFVAFSVWVGMPDWLFNTISIVLAILLFLLFIIGKK